MKKLISSVLIASMITASVFASGNKEESTAQAQGTAEKPVTLSVFGFKTASQAVIIKQLIKEFNEANPDIVVTYEGLTNPGGYENVLTTRLASGQGDDVFFSNPGFITKLVDSGYTEDLSDLKATQNFTQDMSVGGIIPGLSMATSLFGMYANNDVLKECGIDEVPQNIAEFEKDCDILKEKGKTPVVAGASDGTGAAVIIMARGFSDLYLNNPNTASEIKALNTGKEPLSKYLLPGFELAHEFTDKGYIDGKKAIVWNAFTDGLAEFAKGNAGFFIMGNWAVPSINQSMPNADVSFNALPFTEDGPVVLATTSVRLCINKSSKHIAQAKRFIEFMFEAKNNDRYCADQYSFTNLKDGSQEIDPMLINAAKALNAGRNIDQSDTSFTNIDVWGLAKQYGQNLFAGATPQVASDNLDETNAMNISLK